MPLVSVTWYRRHEGQEIAEHQLKLFGMSLKAIVAANLDCPGGPLKNTDVDVVFTEGSEIDSPSRQIYIQIVANWYEARFDNLDERSGKIGRSIRGELAKQYSFWSWVQLIDGSFFESDAVK